MYSKSLRVSLTFATAVILSGYASPSFAAKPDCGVDPTHPSCEGEDPPTTTAYSAALAGAFAFGESSPLAVTPDSKEIELKGDNVVTIERPGNGNLEAVWNTVFAACSEFFDSSPEMIPTEFEAPVEKQGWTIERPGGIRVIFRGIPLHSTVIDENVHITLQLIGTNFFDDPSDLPFLPDDPAAGTSTTVNHVLSKFWILGRTVKGVSPRRSCGGQGDLDFHSTVTITATAPEL